MWGERRVGELEKIWEKGCAGDLCGQRWLRCEAVREFIG